MAIPSILSSTAKRRRAAIAAAITLAALIAAPFFFATPIVRHYLAGSNLHNLHFRSATLNPFGSVTLYDVTLDDPAAPASNPLLTASSLHATFRWSDLSTERFKNITLNNLNATLRPGTAASPTLLRLFAFPLPATTTPATAPTTAPPPPPPLWFDQLLLTGTLHLEGYTTLQKIAQLPPTLPFQAVITMSGPAAAPAREFALTLGDPDNTRNLPFATARLRTRTPADKSTLLTIDTLTLNNLAPALSSNLFPRASLPAALNRPLSAQLNRLQFTGTITFAADTTLNLTADLRDLSAHAADTGLPILLDHFNATTHIDGKWTSTPLKDLTFNGAHCSFDTLQFADWRLTRADADLQSDTSEITLNDLQATLGDAQLNATAAFDLTSLSLSRARIALNNITAANVVRRIPALQQMLPGAIDGALTANLFLTESDADHIAAHLDITCPDRLTLLAPTSQNSPAPAPAVMLPPPPTTLPATEPHPLAAISNLALGATVSWNGHLDSPPEITHGRLTADQFDLASPGGDSALVSATQIKSDFSLTRGIARLDDFYADLPDNAQISAKAAYTLKTDALDEVNVVLDNVDAALFNPWLPAPLALSGQFDANTKVTLSSSEATLYLSISDAPASTIQYAGGTIAIAGAPSPTMTINATADRLHDQVKIDSALHGVSALRIDSGMIAHIRSLVAPAADGAADQLLTRIKAGATLALNDLLLTGTLDASGLPPHFTGNLTIDTMNADTPSVLLPTALPAAHLDTLSFNSALDFPLDPDKLAAQLHITETQITARVITLNKNPITGFSATFNLSNARASFNDIVFTFAGGEFSGNAGFFLPLGLDQLHLRFKSLDQQLLTQTLYPDAFTATGPISGILTLRRAPAAAYAAGGIPYRGDLQLNSDSAGKLKIAPAVSRGIFVSPTPAATNPANSANSSNLDPSFINQLADYSYATSHAQLQDTPRGLALQLDYIPIPPAAEITNTPPKDIPANTNGTLPNPTPPLHLSTTIANTSLTRLLKRLLGFPNSLSTQNPDASHAQSSSPLQAIPN